MSLRKHFNYENLFVNIDSKKEVYTGNSSSLVWNTRARVLAIVSCISMYLDQISILFVENADFYIHYLCSEDPSDHIYCAVDILSVLEVPLKWKIWYQGEIGKSQRDNVEIISEEFNPEKSEGILISNYHLVTSSVFEEKWSQLLKQHGAKKNSYLDNKSPEYQRYLSAERELKDFIEQQNILTLQKLKEYVLFFKPRQAFLTIRFPESQNISFLKGSLMHIPWLNTDVSFKQRYHETIFVCYQEEAKYVEAEWDSREYHEILNRHMQSVRGNLVYYNPIYPDDKNSVHIDEPELLNDWDSCAEAIIFLRLIKLMFVKLDKKEEICIRFSRFLTQEISKNNGITLSQLRRKKMK